MIGSRAKRNAASIVFATAMAVPLSVAAAELGANPTECEIQAALLGVAGPGCPAAAAPQPMPIPTLPPPPAAKTPPQPAATPEPPLRSVSFLITFDFNSVQISAESQTVLDRVAAVMASPQAAKQRFRIVGHTDAVGSDGANLTLSLRRAIAVRDYIVSRHGVAADRLEVEGRGRSRLADPAHPTSPANRRVEIMNLGG